MISDYLTNDEVKLLRDELFMLKHERLRSGHRPTQVLCGYIALTRLHQLADTMTAEDRRPPASCILHARVMNLEIDFCRGCDPNKMRVV
jgi:hypothetical protein